MTFKSVFQRKYLNHHWHFGRDETVGIARHSIILWFAAIMLPPIKLFLLILVLHPIDMSVYITLQKTCWQQPEYMHQELVLSSQLWPHSALLGTIKMTTEDLGASRGRGPAVHGLQRVDGAPDAVAGA